ncbi:hypothetical protein PS662_00795 [Pseudomonas fluorescens]|uniref:Uncharacterized protein n=1 Tax=Pseudomonas fluorescens TaxID=294 RepID=A0A5E6QC56_PSEFL|nr:hypothetical protein PS662_00795 [Pseudomonas fluorescens]
MEIQTFHQGHSLPMLKPRKYSAEVVIPIELGL